MPNLALDSSWLFFVIVVLHWLNFVDRIVPHFGDTDEQIDMLIGFLSPTICGHQVVNLLATIVRIILFRPGLVLSVLYIIACQH